MSEEPAMSAADPDRLFKRAVISENEAYLLAEQRLRQSPDVLAGALQDPDPVGRLLAGVALEWGETEGHDFEAALRYLDGLERHFAGTVAGSPPVQVVVDTLSTRFGGQLAELLALRLVKETRQPSWRVLVTLAYLDRHRTPAVTDALIRYAAATQAPTLQNVSVRVLANLGDAALASKIRAERERLAARGGALPAPVAALAGLASQRA